MHNKKSPDHIFLEELMMELKTNQKGNNDSTLRNISSVLKRKYNINANIEIIDNEHRNFFGMSIFPKKSAIDHMVSEIVEERSRLETIEKIWAKNNEWYIEIDSKLLYDPRINANPAEIVAVLMHEIGHTVYSNKIPARVHKVLSYSMMKVPVKVKKIFTWSKAERLLGLAIVEACTLTSYNTKIEVEADKFAIKEGYKDSLYSFMDKLLKSNGNQYFDVTDDQAEKEIEIMTQWAIVNTSELHFRKTKLRDSINDEMRKTKSEFIRSYLLDIRDDFFGKSTRTKYEELVNEQMIDRQYAIMTDVTEGFRDWFSKRGEVKRISQSDIDIIQVEINRIENEDDRIYVLDLIYNKLDIVELSLDLLKSDKTASRVKVTKSTLLDQKDQLNKLRGDVMKIDITPIRYGSIIRYPAGYEG